MAYEKELDAYFTEHMPEFLSDLKELVAIPSVAGEPSKEYPNGKEPARALAKGLDLAKKFGLYTENWDNFVGIVQNAPGKRRLDIIAHLDVVPADGKWTVTKPFEMKEQDGRIYGRGTADDKGPALVALYVLRALKELGIPLSHNVRIMLGTSEETGCKDRDYYIKKAGPAEMSFSPDGDYPVVNIEKGTLQGRLSAEFEAAQIVSISAGSAFNIIPETAEAVLKNADENALKAALAKCNVGCEITQEGSNLKLVVKGTPSHASNPDKGNNPVTALVSALAECTNCKEMKDLSELFPHGKNHGEVLELDTEDESGRTTLVLTVLNYDGKTLKGVYDSRIPASLTKEKADSVCAVFENKGFKYEHKYQAAHVVPADCELVKVLTSCYEKFTGKDGTPLAMGGNTYAHGIPNAVAFGCAFSDVDNRMHGNDEFAEISTLEVSMRIFAQAIIELCK